MSKTTFKSLLFIVLAIIPMTFFGQEKTASNNWFFGIEGGATTMLADNEALVMDQTSWNAGIHAGYTLKNALSIYANLGYADLKGKNGEWMKIDECNLFSGSINFGYNVLQLFSFNPERRWSVMPHVGLGAIMHRTKATINGTEIKNGYDEKGATEGHGIGGRKAVYTNNFGLKVSYSISQRFDLGLDFVTVKTDTEGLDNWRNGKHSDWYGTANIALTYKFGRKEVKPCPECPECEPATPDCEACKDAIKDAVEEALKNYQPAPAEPEKEEAEETEAIDNLERNFEERDIHLTFKVGKAEVVDNQSDKEQVKKVSEDIDNGREIHTIKTIGYASPEGNDKANQKLSEDRAKATAEYIEKKLGDKAEGISFEPEGRGSDWDGFYKALENSNMANKAEIAEQIKNADDPTAKLNELRGKNSELNSILNGLRVTRVYINK